jgi:hypothetical protein
MSDEKRALTRHSAPPDEADYEAILDAVMETGRGRWFLHEFARRNRHSETRGVLNAIQRIESALRAQGTLIEEPAHDAAADPIRAALARAAGMLRADGEPAEAFDRALAELESAQARIRAAATRVQDAAYMLREDGGPTRICNDLDRHSAELSAGSAQLNDAAGDMRILAALLKDIARHVTAHHVAPPENDLSTGVPVDFVSAEATTDIAADISDMPVEAVVAAEPVPHDPGPACMPADPLPGPADFLLEPLPDAEEAAMPTPEPERDAFDPLAPIRALSDEEKIALFS